MSTHTVARAFKTRTRRFTEGQSIAPSDLADDAMPLTDRIARGDLAEPVETAQAEPVPLGD